jgi:D-alanine-D-alanine ligase
MQVALTYNVKSEQPISDANESSDPSSKPAGVHTDTRPLLSYDDTYAEWDSWDTIDALRSAIALKHDVQLIEANEDACEALRTYRPDFVFNVAEGFNGISREAQIPALCEMLRLPYLGSDPLTLSLCLDKARTKEVLSYHTIPNASFVVYDSPASVNGRTFGYPQIVKPLHEGSSKGIYNSSLVHSDGELIAEVSRIVERYGQPAMVESFLPGREFTVALLGNGEFLRALPIVEIRHDALPEGVNPIYSYEAKWVWDRPDEPLDIFACPADIDDDLRRSIEKICIDTYRILRCRDWARIDVRLDAAGIPHIIEVNPLPGILPNEADNSCFPKAARAAGMDYAGLIQSVMDTSVKRWNIV